MKRAVSISLGSSKRDKKVVIRLKGEEIQVERMGMDSDIAKARQLRIPIGKASIGRCPLQAAVYPCRCG